ncbi:MAG TPA: Rieske (2Fe-2S) protein [Pseudoxanthomonas sp.]
MSDPSNKPCACSCACQPVDSGRRNMLSGALALAALAPAMGANLGANAQAAAPAAGTRSQKPEPGDKLAFMIGPKQGKEVLPKDIEIGKPPALAYPMDPQSGKVLISKANLLTVVRLKPVDLKPTSARNAADGIVAFSSLCTHYGCPITTLHPSQTQIVCNCHGSIFDAANRGAVTQGPATRRLAMLPLTIKDGVLLVAGKFDGPLGPPV